MREGVSAEVLLLREVIEGVLAPEIASRVMFEALEIFGRVPSGLEEVMALIDGPLHGVLEQQVGPDEGDAVIDRARWMLGRGGSGSQAEAEEQESGEHPLPAMEALQEREGTPSTRSMPMSWLRPVSVLVAARSDLFAQKLLLSLGPARVRPTRIGTARELRDRFWAEEPLLVLVDAHDPPDLAAERLGGALGMLPEHVVSVIWGADTVYGMRLERCIDGRVVRIHEREGFEPLVDLVGSRHAPRPMGREEPDG